MQVGLVSHPGHRPNKVRRVAAGLIWKEQAWPLLVFTVEPAGTVLLPDHKHRRLDNLWRSTCFELFVKASGGGYREFNFAPLGGWNAYSFTDWRKGMKPLELSAEPNLVDMRIDDRHRFYPARYELDVVLPPDALPPAGSKLSLTAVIEEKDGTKSYWALAHPPGEPNFHDPACFVLELPPPSAA